MKLNSKKIMPKTKKIRPINFFNLFLKYQKCMKILAMINFWYVFPSYSGWFNTLIFFKFTVCDKKQRIGFLQSTEKTMCQKLNKAKIFMQFWILQQKSWKHWWAHCFLVSGMIFINSYFFIVLGPPKKEIQNFLLPEFNPTQYQSNV